MVTETDLYNTAATDLVATANRKRSTKAEVQQLDQQIVSVLAEDWPQSVRHVYYRMTDPRLPHPVPKTDAGYRQVQNRLVKLRRSGDVPYHWITDATRRGYHVSTYRNAGEFIRTVAGMYRADIWAEAPYYVEVWAESRSIAGVIEDDCRDMAVSLYPSGGFTSLSLAYQAARYIEASIRGTNKRPVIFYIGDYDPAGVLIDQKIKEEIEGHLDRPFEFIRLGITPEQIEQHALPTKPRKESDRRAEHIKETVEAEAMPAHILRAILRREVEQLMPYGSLQAAKVAEKSEIEGLKRLGLEIEGAGQ